MRYQLLGGLCLLLTTTLSFANLPPVDANIKENTVKQIGELMKANYVYPDKGKEAAAFLIEKLQAGDFDNITESKAFADALTKAVQEVTKDKHLRLRPNRSGGQHHTEEDAIKERVDRQERFRQFNQGVAQVRKLENNVGYLQLDGFAGFPGSKAAIDAAMELLKTSDAIIIDLRKNGGGDPFTVQYLCSYFFEEHLLLNSLYWREGGVTEEFWTLEKVDGTKLPDIPLYVLTSNYTFSGAEEFSYNMQTRKRATLVGETTGGGANPGGGFKINDHFGMFIATGRAINPVTGISWEGTGVVPEVKVEADKAFDKATKLASEVANQVRTKARQQYKQASVSLNHLLADTAKKVEEHNVDKLAPSFFEAIKPIAKALNLTEERVNELGYSYMIQKQLPLISVLLMKFNTHENPDSANAYDSLGDALLAANNPEKAKMSFAKGLLLADKNDVQLIEVLTKNLAKATALIQKSDG